MNIQSLFKKILPHLLIIAGFLVISAFYFSPILKGMVLKQHDYMQFLGSSKEALDFNKATGESAYWTNSMFGGMPTYQIALGYPKSAFIVGWIYTFCVKLFAHPLNSLFFYMVGFYFLLLSYKLDRWVCAIGALAFAFSSYNLVIISAGHINKSYAIAFAPFILAAINYIFLWRKYLLGTALLALATVTEIKANHIQITYYLFILIGIYALYQLYVHITEKRINDFIKASAGLAIGIILAFGANFTSTYVTNEYATQTIRGKSELTTKANTKDGLDKDYALDWSYGIAETGTLMIPDFRGGAQAAIGQVHESVPRGLADQNAAQYVAQMDEYWGVEPATGVIYFGALVCFLFVLGMFALKGAERWWLLGATILFIMLSWGKYFLGLTDFFFDHFPLYNKFRSVSMILAMASITVPILGFIILDRISKDPSIIKNNLKNLYISFGLTGGICLILAMAPSMAGSFLQEATLDKDGKVERKSERSEIQANVAQSGNMSPEQAASVTSGIVTSLAEARETILRQSALRSLAFIALGAGAIFLFGTGRINRTILLGSIGALVLIDMPFLDQRYINNEMFQPKSIDTEQQVPMTAADAEILNDKDPDYRVLNLNAPSGPFNDATTSYYHKSIGGYHGAKLRRIQELITAKIWPDINKFFMNPDSAGSLNMLNTKYIIYKADQNHPNGVLRNPAALGNAWLIKKVELANTADEEMAMLDKVNPKNTGIVNNKFADYFKDAKEWSDSGTVKLDKYSPNELNYTSNAAADGFIVFSEVYYNPNIDKDWHKGDWQAYVDGKEVDHIRIDYVLRGMKVPAGKHAITFKFIPHSYLMAENVSFASSILILLLLAGSIFMEMKNRKEEEVVVPQPAAGNKKGK